MKKSILNLGKNLNKKKQRSISGGGTQSCPPINCYYGNSDTELFGGAIYCGNCSDFNNLPASCQKRVRVGFYCFGV